MIRFLIGENLPATLLAMLPVPCLHATDLGDQPTDVFLWEYARQEGWTLLTKDADFFDRIILHGSPPKVVWVRTGNLRRSALDNLIVIRMPLNLNLLSEADLVEVHDDRLESFRI